jgi:hypothetical protein
MERATTVRAGFAGVLFAGALALGASQASAMPAFDHSIASATQVAQPEQVRWVCGPWRCWWRPNYFYRPYAFWRPRPWWGPRPYWGFYRPHRFWGFYPYHRWGGWRWHRWG